MNSCSKDAKHKLKEDILNMYLTDGEYLKYIKELLLQFNKKKT